MALPEITGDKIGLPMFPLIWDGSKWVAISKATFDDILTALEIIDGFADAQNVIFGYNDRYNESLSKAATGATEIMAGTKVPAGEIWVIEAMYATNANRQPTLIYLQVSDGAIFQSLVEEQPLAAGRRSMWDGKITLKEDDYVRIVMTGCVAGDSLEAATWGYKMKIA